MTINKVLLIIAIIVFALAFFGVNVFGNMIALGLAFFASSFLA